MNEHTDRPPESSDDPTCEKPNPPMTRCKMNWATSFWENLSPEDRDGYEDNINQE